MQLQLRLLTDIKELIRKYGLPRKCADMAFIAIARGAKLMTLALVFAVGFSTLTACSRKHEQVREASESNPDVTPPIGPVCTVRPFHADGEFAPPMPRLSTTDVFIKDFDRSKGDTLAISYKCWLCSVWKPVPEGGSSEAIVYSVNKSTVTLSYQHVGQWNWSLSANINVCN